MTHINRLFGIVHLLLHRKRLTSTELARHFEVSKRTILRDIDVLSGVGIPIYTAKGKGGGIAILDSYTLNKTAISEHEQQSILSSLQGFNALPSIHSSESDYLLSKLSHLFGKQQSNWIEIDFANWTDNDQRQIKVDVIKKAIVDHQAIEFDYANSQGESSRRQVYPLKLLFKSQDWYLHAYCQVKLAYRFFKLNRINQLTPLALSFDPSSLPELKMDTPLHESSPQIKLEIQFSANVAFRVYDEFPLQHITRSSDGGFVVSMMISDDDWLINYLLSYGDSATVISPQSLRQALKQQAQAMIERYH